MHFYASAGERTGNRWAMQNFGAWTVGYIQHGLGRRERSSKFVQYFLISCLMDKTEKNAFISGGSKSTALGILVTRRTIILW